MNYKLMRRPMFRLGGNVRQNYSKGTPFSEELKGKSLQELFQMQAASADKQLSGLNTLRDLARLQTLGGLTSNVLPNIETRNPLRFISEFFSNPETINLALRGLGGLRSVDAKAGEIKGKAISDKIKGELAFEKLAIEKLKGTTTKTKMNYDATKEALEKTNLSDAQKNDILLGVISGGSYQTVQKRSARLRDSLNKQIENGMLTRSQAEDIIKNFEATQLSIFQERENDAEGGRVGFQDGTPNPEFTMPEPKPREAVQDRQLDTLMQAAPALENPNEAKSMSEKDMYGALRRRLPQEITDDVVRLIAYNPEAFADFADIQDQSDVDSFNQKYNVQLVLPVENVT
jgi:hypothetical protein